MSKGRGDNVKKIIVRREEVAEAGHHGGSWKIAYADFVTAMMAFFLVMWLINATTEQQRRGIANFFNPLAETTDTQPPADGMINTKISPMVQGSRLVDSKFKAADKDDDTKQDKTIMPSGGLEGSASVSGNNSDGYGTGKDAHLRGVLALHTGGEDQSFGVNADASPAIPKIVPIGSGNEDFLAGNSKVRGEERVLQNTAAQITNVLHNDPVLRTQSDGVSVEVTPQGLRIQLADAQSRPMFESGSARVNARALTLLKRIAPFLTKLDKNVSIAGYTDAAPYKAGHLSNWTLSALRADSARDVIVAAGFPDSMISGVTGYADRDLAFPKDALAAGNRRVILTVHKDATAVE